MKISIVDQTEDDLVDGYNFYEDQAPGLGAYFLNCIYSDVESLVLYAGIHRIVHRNYHRMLSEKFPFAIYLKRHYTVGSNSSLSLTAMCEEHGYWLLS